MCSDPTNKQMNLLCTEHIFTDQPIPVPIDIEDNPIGSPTNKISVRESFLDVCWNIPVRKPDLG